MATRGAAVTVAAAAAAAAAAAVRRLPGRRFGVWATGPRRGARRPWHTATVYCPSDRVAPDGRLPEPLARLADTVEVRIRPAPGGRGTELAVRPRDGRPPVLARMIEGIRGRDGRYAVRTALREAKQLLETGEVLRPDRPPTSRSTLLNRPVRIAVRLGREGGRL
ncbi:MAG: hypothetical protein FWJ93_12655 [Micromonosporaceae bacterium]